MLCLLCLLCLVVSVKFHKFWCPAAWWQWGPLWWRVSATEMVTCLQSTGESSQLLDIFAKLTPDNGQQLGHRNRPVPTGLLTNEMMRAETEQGPACGLSCSGWSGRNSRGDLKYSNIALGMFHAYYNFKKCQYSSKYVRDKCKYYDIFCMGTYRGV